MTASLGEGQGNPVEYNLVLGEQELPLNSYLEQNVRLEFQGNISCIHCARKTKKSFSQGFCYPCFKKLAQCDTCIMSPEKCHHHEGTCREPEWGETWCMQDHFVYLANSSGTKVGITRQNQLPTRWIDQGAAQALPIFRVSSRRISGLVETAFKAHIADKTHWQRMLKSDPEPVDLMALRDNLVSEVQSALDEIRAEFGDLAIRPVEDAEILEITYPIAAYPTKVKSFNFDKTPEVSGKLMGIKGQYLILDSGVINLRKFTGYEVSFDA